VKTNCFIRLHCEARSLPCGNKASQLTLRTAAQMPLGWVNQSQQELRWPHTCYKNAPFQDSETFTWLSHCTQISKPTKPFQWYKET
jgi:hypothetical protein